jgi:single-strand DNA-binding protein
MNSIVLLGRTTSTIELKQTQAGKSVANLALAVKRPFTKDTTDFFNVVAFDKQAELLSRYVDKGKQVCIRGHLTTRTWTDKQGNKRHEVEVVADEVSFVGSNDSTAETKTDPTAYTPTPYINAAAPRFEEVADDGNLPF